MKSIAVGRRPRIGAAFFIATLQGSNWFDPQGREYSILPVSLLESPKTVNPQRHHRRIQLRDQQTGTGPEGVHATMLCALSFGKDQQVVAAVKHLAGKDEAAAEAALLRHRKDIEEENDG